MGLTSGRRPLRTAVAFFVFNRPDTTEIVFSAIARARPPRLLVVADGPRVGRAADEALCASVRDIIGRVDWSCEVLTHFSDVNLGCRERISSGLDWVFDNVDEAIILEDDCLPDPTFFEYCESLLERYRDDERIMTISGDNFQGGHERGPYSYYYSRFTHIWGWATWRRAWRHYDVAMQRWPDFRAGGWLTRLLGRGEARYWDQMFQAVYEGRIETWDFQWTFACWTQGALTTIPNVNLVSNVGFRPDATHTRDPSDMAALPRVAMQFPLVEPPFVIRHSEADTYTQRMHYRPPNRAERFARALARRVVPRQLTGGKRR